MISCTQLRINSKDPRRTIMIKSKAGSSKSRRRMLTCREKLKIWRKERCNRLSRCRWNISLLRTRKVRLKVWKRHHEPRKISKNMQRWKWREKCSRMRGPSSWCQRWSRSTNEPNSTKVRSNMRSCSSKSWGDFVSRICRLSKRGTKDWQWNRRTPS